MNIYIIIYFFYNHTLCSNSHTEYTDKYDDFTPIKTNKITSEMKKNIIETAIKQHQKISVFLMNIEKIKKEFPNDLVKDFNMKINEAERIVEKFVEMKLESYLKYICMSNDVLKMLIDVEKVENEVLEKQLEDEIK